MSDLHTSDWYTDPSLIGGPFFTYYEAVGRAQGPIWREPITGHFVVTGLRRDGGDLSRPESFSIVQLVRRTVSPASGRPATATT